MQAIPGSRSRKLRRKSLGGEGTDGIAVDRVASSPPGGGEKAPLLSAVGVPFGGTCGGDELLNRLRARDPFTSARWRCIKHPDRALQTLSGWARLDINVGHGLDLVQPQENIMGTALARTSIFVYSDDMFVYSTPTVGGTEPIWNHDGFLNIIAPDTMVRIQVQHDDHQGMGFVEFCVADLPFDKEIDGYFELRFQERLQWTSTKRYAEHCKRRDEHDYVDEVSDDEMTDIHGSTLRSRSTDTLSKQARRHRHFCCRFGSHDEAAQNVGGYRHNAGEIHLKLKLVLTTSSKVDWYMAQALPRPTPKNFGVSRMNIHGAGVADLQGLNDELNFLKTVVVDDCLLCVKNYVLYILKWRHTVVSLSFFMLFLAFNINEWLQGPLVLLLIPYVLVINWFPELRHRMATAGDNAPLTEEGFSLVAGLMHADEMAKFLKRTVEVTLGATTRDTGQLKLLSERCFRDGIPQVSFEELKISLKTASWLKCSKDFAPGSLVMVKNKHPATVVQVTPETATITWDQGVKKTSRGEQTFPLEDIVPRLDLTTRQAMLAPILPEFVDVKVREIRSNMDNLKMRLVPTIEKAIKIATWQPSHSKYSLGLLWGTLFLSLGFFLFSEWYRLCGAVLVERGRLQQKFRNYLREEFPNLCGADVHWSHLHGIDYVFQFMVAFCVDHGASTLILLAGSFVLLKQAEWRKPFVAMQRIISRSLFSKREAPKKWQFFRESMNKA